MLTSPASHSPGIQHDLLPSRKGAAGAGLAVVSSSSSGSYVRFVENLKSLGTGGGLGLFLVLVLEIGIELARRRACWAVGVVV